MIRVLACILILIFLFISGMHVFWAFGGRIGGMAAIPEINGKPSFSPTAGMTLLVAFAFVCAALLVAGTSGILKLPVPHAVLKWLTYLMALVFLARSIGEFRLVGFFKQIRGTPFAEMDTFFYSPLCLGIAIVAAIIGFTPRD
ncbi:MAG: DUF3995 domain-containing protein [Acidobacteria bacterium]|nr:DUF3995 domain-containing protein [Acidobacteriota bacterium]